MWETHIKSTGTGLSGLHCTGAPPRIEARGTGDSLDGLALYELGDAFMAIAAEPHTTTNFAR